MYLRSSYSPFVVSLLSLTLVACGQAEDRASTSGDAESGVRRLPKVDSQEHPSRPHLAEHPVTRLRIQRSLGGSANFAQVTAIVPFRRFLVVADPDMPPTIKIVDLQSGAMTHAFGPHGQGPGEFVDPRFLTRLAENPPRLQVLDFQNRRISRYTLSSDGRREELEGTLALAVNAPIFQAMPLPDGTGYLANGLFRAFSLMVLDSVGHEVRRLSTDPPFSKADFGLESPLGLANLKRVAADLAGNRYAMAYQNTSRIDLLASPDGPVRTVLGPREPNKKITIKGGHYIRLEGDEIAYVSVFVTHSRVYALYCECASDDEAESFWAHGPYQVDVFAWNGEYLGELELDHEIIQVAVSRDDSLLWSMYEDPIPYIGEWALPNWVKGN